jgi:HAAS
MAADLIDEYVRTLRSEVGRRPDVDEIIAEAEDHLYSTAERFAADGADWLGAQQSALERFGEPRLVARAFATIRSTRPAMPTPATRDAGRFAFVSAILWLVTVGGWWAAALIDPVGEVDSPGSVMAYVMGAIALIGATLLLFLTMTGLAVRHGSLGRLGAIGLVSAAVAVVGSLLAWVFTVWASLLLVATLLVSVAMLRRQIAPRIPTITFGGGLLVGALAWMALRLRVGVVDLSGLWGDWFENLAGLTIGIAILVIGLVGLGRWLRSEEPVVIDRSDRVVPV